MEPKKQDVSSSESEQWTAPVTPQTKRGVGKQGGLNRPNRIKIKSTNMRTKGLGKGESLTQLSIKRFLVGAQSEYV